MWENLKEHFYGLHFYALTYEKTKKNKNKLFYFKTNKKDHQQMFPLI
jgi:hypothetical protein